MTTSEYVDGIPVVLNFDEKTRIGTATIKDNGDIEFVIKNEDLATTLIGSAKVNQYVAFSLGFSFDTSRRNNGNSS